MADRVHGIFNLPVLAHRKRRQNMSFKEAGTAPMTRMSLAEVRAAFEDRITIWGGIPSVLLCRDSASGSDFRLWIDDLIERYGHSSRFVLGVSDMVTADAEWDRLEYITEKVSRLS